MVAISYDSLTEKSTALKDLFNMFIYINYADVCASITQRVELYIVIGINLIMLKVSLTYGPTPHWGQ